MRKENSMSWLRTKVSRYWLIQKRLCMLLEQRWISLMTLSSKEILPLAWWKRFFWIINTYRLYMYTLYGQTNGPVQNNIFCLHLYACHFAGLSSYLLTQTLKGSAAAENRSWQLAIKELLVLSQANRNLQEVDGAHLWGLKLICFHFLESWDAEEFLTMMSWNCNYICDLTRSKTRPLGWVVFYESDFFFGRKTTILQYPFLIFAGSLWMIWVSDGLYHVVTTLLNQMLGGYFWPLFEWGFVIFWTSYSHWIEVSYGYLYRLFVYL